MWRLFLYKCSGEWTAVAGEWVERERERDAVLDRSAGMYAAGAARRSLYDNDQALTRHGRSSCPINSVSTGQGRVALTSDTGLMRDCRNRKSKHDSGARVGRRVGITATTTIESHCWR